MFPYKPVVYQLKEGDLIEEGGPVIGAEPRVEHIQSGGHQDVSQSEGSQKHSQVSPQNHGGQYCVKKICRKVLLIARQKILRLRFFYLR